MRISEIPKIFHMLPLSNTPYQREPGVLAGVISGCPGGVFEKVLEKREGENSATGGSKRAGPVGE